MLLHRLLSRRTVCNSTDAPKSSRDGSRMPRLDVHSSQKSTPQRKPMIGRKFLASVAAACLTSLIATSVAGILRAAPLLAPASALQQSTAGRSAQPPATPAGKLLLSQEIQLTGDQLWVDTNIDIHPGERLVFSASGSLRYPDAKTDN